MPPLAAPVMSRIESRPDAAKVQANGERCRRSLHRFHKAAWRVHEPGVPFVDDWYQGYLCEHLEAVSLGEIRELAIFIAPRHGKSTLVSVAWPAWEWIDRPSTRFIFASYSDRLATGLSVDRRFLIQSPWYQDRYGERFKLSGDQNTKTQLENDARGAMFSTSMLGTVTGEGAEILVFDDPMSPRQAASEAERLAAREAFDKTFPSRLNDQTTGRKVAVMQRLHVEDLGARMVELGWQVIKLQGVAKERTTYSFPRSGKSHTVEIGDCLSPSRVGPEEHARLKSEMGPTEYAAQYDQEPVPDKGILFNRAWFKVVEHPPAQFRRIVRFWDKAITQGGGAYSAGSHMGLDYEGRYWIIDMQRGQWSAHNREQAILNTARTDGLRTHIGIEQEPGSSGIRDAQLTIKMLAGFVVKAERATGDKVTRARALAAQAEAGNVFVLNREWTPDLLAEFHTFPQGRYKDQVDASSGAFNMLAAGKSAGGYAIAADEPGNS